MSSDEVDISLESKLDSRGGSERDSSAPLAALRAKPPTLTLNQGWKRIRGSEMRLPEPKYGDGGPRQALNFVSKNAATIKPNEPMDDQIQLATTAEPLDPQPPVTETEELAKMDEATSEPEADKKDGDGKAEQDKPKPTVKQYLRILSYGTTLDYCLMGLTTLTSIGVGAAMPLMFVVFGQLVGDFAGYFTPNSTITKAQFQHSANKNALYIVYLFIAKFCLAYISMLAIRISGLRISASIRLAYIRALFIQPVSVIDQISPGKVSTRITTSSNTIQDGISQKFALFIQGVAFFIALYVVAFIKSWSLTLVASSCMPFILLAYGTFLPFYLKFHKHTEEILEEASSLAFEVFGSIRIVIAFGAEKKLATQHDDLVLQAKKSEQRCGPLMGLMMAPGFFALYATFALTFWFGIKQYLNGNVEGINNIVVVMFSVVMAVGAVSQFTNPVIAISKAATAATELFATIDSKPPDMTGLKSPDVSIHSDITFRDVSFAYPTRPDVQVLHHLNLTIEAGKVTALVGPSGSGKSTIVALLERWYGLGNHAEIKASVERGKNTSEDKSPKTPNDKPSATIGGSIRIGDVDLSDVDGKWWRSQIGLVQQEPFLFNDTIYNNIAYGLCGTPLQDASREEKLKLVKEACKEAFADDFISKFPQGYDTVVGESGIKMSGGQRQRIAIARSIIKQPSILILDEATSSIDVRTERIVQRALDRVSKNRTTIVIAHRLSTIKRADKIAVLRQGNVAEEGTHSELLENEEGVYSGLVLAQGLSMGHEGTENDLIDAKIEVQETHAEGSESGAANGERTTEEARYKSQDLVRSFGRLIYEQRSHWVLYSLTILGAIGCGAVYPLQAYLFAKLIEAFTLSASSLSSRGNFWSLMFFIQAIGVGISYFVLGWASYAASIAVSTFYRQEYLSNILHKRVSFFDSEGNSSGTLTSRLSNDPTQLQQLMGTDMSMALIAVFNLIGSVTISFVFGWKLSIVCLFAVLPVILFAGFIRVKLEMEFEKLNAAVFADSSQFATEAIGAFRTVTSLILEETIITRYSNLLKGHVLRAFVKARISTVVFAFSDSVELACMALAFWYGGRLLASREYDLVEFFVIYMAITQGSQAAGMWFSFAPNMAEAKAAANRIISLRPAKDGYSSGRESLLNPEGGAEVEFRDVNFTYKTRNIPVLNGLSFKVEAGQFAALVGHSGCGKSTTISLLEKFYDPDSGSIHCDGQDISTLDAAAYRRTISLVAQEPTLYEGTIRDNVALSVDASQATDEAIQQACIDAQIHEFITSLPQGYATRLGPKGVSLSGGQKQRLALARALLRRPRLLLLDEATSSLDSTSEALVQQAIERAAEDGGRTIIAVAHRLATIQKADVIFVIGSGKVLEKGTHQELLNLKGVYYQMCQAQALDR